MFEQVQEQKIVQRMIGAAMLQPEKFNEVEHDTSATKQAMAVVAMVAMVAVATGIGSLGAGGPVGFVIGIVAGIGLWALWAWITYFVGTTILKTPETEAN